MSSEIVALLSGIVFGATLVTAVVIALALTNKYRRPSQDDDPADWWKNKED